MDQGFCIADVIFDESGAPFDLQLVEANPGFEKQTGLPGIAGLKARQMVANIANDWLQLFGDVALTGLPKRFSKYSKGLGRWFEVYAFRLDGVADNRIAILFTDITARKRDEAALRQATARQGETLALLESLLQNAPVGFAFFDKDRRYLRVNQTLADINGLPVAKHIGQTVEQLLPEGIGQATGQLLDDVLRTKRPVLNTEFVSANLSEPDKVLHCLSSFYPVLDAQGEANFVGAVVTEISSLKETEQALKLAKEQLELTINNIPSSLYLIDKNARLLYVNEQAARSFGMTVPELLAVGSLAQLDAEAAKLYDRFDEEGRLLDPMRTPAAVTMQTGKPACGTVRIVHRENGHTQWHMVQAAPLLDENGGLRQLLITTTDITEQKKAEAAIRESESRFRTLADNLPDVISRHDTSFRYLYANPHITKHLGRTPEELVGKSFRELGFPEALCDFFEQHINVVFQTRQLHTVEFASPAGAGHIYARLVPEFDENRQVTSVLIMNTDLTEQKLAQEKLKESESRFRTLAESMPQMVWITGADGMAEWQNLRWKEFFGTYHKDNDWMEMLHPDDVQRTTDVWLGAVSTGRDYEIEYRFLDRTTNEYRWFLGKALPVKDGSGKVTKWFGTCTDIHDQKTLTERLEQLVAERTRELVAANDELTRSNHDLQQFAHVTSHDLKEPLRKIKVFVGMLHKELQNNVSGEGHAYLDKVRQATDRMQTMIDGILSYSSLRATAQNPHEPVDLNRIIEQVRLDLELLIAQKNARFLTDPLPQVKGSPVLLHQLFYNLAANALKFAKAGVEPLVSVRVVYLTHEAQSGGTGWVEISITDNGIGFEPQYTERIFDTFVRLNPKDEYEGTGLGLALCKKIAQRHGGTIRAMATPGQGAVFTVTLPLYQSESA
jgi:hypothetical protein